MRATGRLNTSNQDSNGLSDPHTHTVVATVGGYCRKDNGVFGSDGVSQMSLVRDAVITKNRRNSGIWSEVPLRLKNASFCAGFSPPLDTNYPYDMGNVCLS